MPLFSHRKAVWEVSGTRNLLVLGNHLPYMYLTAHWITWAKHTQTAHTQGMCPFLHQNCVQFYLFIERWRDREKINRQIETGRPRELSKGWQQPGLGYAKATGPELNPDLSMAGRDPPIWTITCCLPGCTSQEARIEHGARTHPAHIDVVCGHPFRYLNC